MRKKRMPTIRSVQRRAESRAESRADQPSARRSALNADAIASSQRNAFAAHSCSRSLHAFCTAVSLCALVASARRRLIVPISCNARRGLRIRRAARGSGSAENDREQAGDACRTHCAPLFPSAIAEQRSASRPPLSTTRDTTRAEWRSPSLVSTHHTTLRCAPQC